MTFTKETICLFLVSYYTWGQFLPTKLNKNNHPELLLTDIKFKSWGFIVKMQVYTCHTPMELNFN